MEYCTFEITLEEQVAATTHVEHLAAQGWDERFEFLFVVVFHISLGFHIHAKRVVVQQTIILIFFHIRLQTVNFQLSAVN